MFALATVELSTEPISASVKFKFNDVKVFLVLFSSLLTKEDSPSSDQEMFARRTEICYQILTVSQTPYLVVR